MSGTRYTYTKTRVAHFVPFIFLIPAAIIGFIVFLLNTRSLATGEFLFNLSTGSKLATAVLLILLFFVIRDLWRTFSRTVSEEIWVTNRDIVWLGRGSKVLIRSPHQDILDIVRVGPFMFEIRTKHGSIRFTRSLEFVDELIARVETFLGNSRKMQPSPPSQKMTDVTS